MHQDKQVFINANDTVIREPQLQTISNIEIPALCIAKEPTKKNRPTLTASCEYEIYINEILITPKHLACHVTGYTFDE